MQYQAAYLFRNRFEMCAIQHDLPAANFCVLFLYICKNFTAR